MEKLTGILIVFSSTVLYGLMYVLNKKASLKMPPFNIMVFSMFTLFVASLILSFIFENGVRLKMENKETILLLIATGLINVLGFFLYIQGFKYMAIWQQTMFNLLIPVFAGIFAYFILGESISPKIIIGLLIMGVGLAVVVK